MGECMKVFYQFNFNPFCAVCMDTMFVSRPNVDPLRIKVAPSEAFCRNEKCAQFEQKFIIEPLSAEATPLRSEKHP